jgi:hypothetical protein
MDANLFQWIKEDLKEMRAELKSEIKTLDEKVDQLLKFKWQVVGGTILASLLISASFQIVLAIISR